MGLDAMEPEARPEPPLHLAPRPSEFATETGPPDVLIRDETDSASVGTTAGVSSSGTSELVEYVYAALLERLQAHCRHVLSVAESEAETVRTRAQEEARHIVADAHREQLMLLSKASAKQALMYQEAEADIDRWLDELEEQRVAVLASARGEYDGLVRKRFEAADRESRSIIEAAHAEAVRMESAPAIPPPRPPSSAAVSGTSSGTHADTEALFEGGDASTEHDGAWIDEPARPSVARQAQERSDTSAQPVPEHTARKRRRWFRVSRRP